MRALRKWPTIRLSSLQLIWNLMIQYQDRENDLCEELFNYSHWQIFSTDFPISGKCLYISECGSSYLLHLARGTKWNVETPYLYELEIAAKRISFPKEK